MANSQDKDILYVNKYLLHKNLSNMKDNNSNQEKFILMFNHYKKTFYNPLPDSKWTLLSIKMISNHLLNKNLLKPNQSKLNNNLKVVKRNILRKMLQLNLRNNKLNLKILNLNNKVLKNKSKHNLNLLYNKNLNKSKNNKRKKQHGQSIMGK